MEARKHRAFFLYCLQRIFYFKNSILFAIFIAGLMFAINQINLARYFPIHKVRVYGAKEVSPIAIEDIVKPLVSQGFFTLKLETMQDQLRQLPWITDIFIKRIWPDEVDITLIEKKPIAFWHSTNNDKKNILLSDAGELFSPNDHFSRALPTLQGPPGMQIVMLNYFADMNRILAPIHANISQLELTSFLTWKLQLNNGIFLQLGSQEVLTRLAHFVKVYPKIIGQRAADVAYIDLRYANGIAVRWKED